MKNSIMTAKEQNSIKRAGYREAMRCVKEARNIMKKAPKDDGYNDFIKYKKDIRKICMTAYNGMSVALDTYLKLENAVPISKQNRSNIYYMQELVGKIDCGVSTNMYSAHNILYWLCCCDGMSYTSVIEMGFENVMNIINKIKPRYKMPDKAAAKQPAAKKTAVKKITGRKPSAKKPVRSTKLTQTEAL